MPTRRLVMAGCPVEVMTQADAIEMIAAAAGRSSGPALAVASANLDHLHHFGRNGRGHGHAMVDTAGLTWVNLLDGAPLVARAKVATGQAWPRLAGSDLLLPILRRAARDGHSVGFLGGAPEMLRLLEARLDVELPTLDVRGYWSPDRQHVTDPELSAQLADEVARSGVGILVVGLGKPRQEIWIQRHAQRSRARVLLAFGASADFLAGTTTRAPEWMRSAGVEWLFRLSREPRRLARRYLVQGPAAAARLLGPAPLSDSTPPDATLALEPLDTRALTAIVVTYNSKGEIDALLDSIPAAAPGLAVEVIVVDNASTDGTADHLRARGDVTVIESGRNAGYAGAINIGRKHAARGVPLAILNPDLVLHAGALTALVDVLHDPTIGVVVPRLIDSSGSVFPSLRREPTLLRGLGDALFGARLPGRSATWSDTVRELGDYSWAHDVDWASGAAWVVSAACDDAVGGWSERFFLYSEETDYARRVRRVGLRIRFEPTSVARHIGAASGSSPDLCALMEVNRLADYSESHGRLASTAYRAVVALRQALRANQPGARRALHALLSQRLSRELFAEQRTGGRP